MSADEARGEIARKGRVHDRKTRHQLAVGERYLAPFASMGERQCPGGLAARAAGSRDGDELGAMQL